MAIELLSALATTQHASKFLTGTDELTLSQSRLGLERHCLEGDSVMHKTTEFRVALLMLVSLAPLLSGCYTARGAGEDLQSVGRGISHSSERNTHYSP